MSDSGCTTAPLFPAKLPLARNDAIPAQCSTRAISTYSGAGSYRIDSAPNVASIPLRQCDKMRGLCSDQPAFFGGVPRACNFLFLSGETFPAMTGRSALGAGMHTLDPAGPLWTPDRIAGFGSVSQTGIIGGLPHRPAAGGSAAGVGGTPVHSSQT
jgi:hypothetical protein